jgi:hypothetical protein
MKKIGILAFFHPQTRNYGAILQTFALSEVVRQLGYEVELIDIRDSTRNTTFIRKVKQFVKNKIEGNPFRLFLENKVCFSKPLYSFSELNTHAKDYYAVIVGSDQVWRPEYCGSQALNFFLDFVPRNVKRIAYAVSFGLEDWDVGEDLTFQARKEVEAFHAVSVRELSGVHICKEVFGIYASQVLDPTLLAAPGLFHELIGLQSFNSTSESKYIASFFLDKTEESTLIESVIASNTGLSVNRINKRIVAFFGKKVERYLSIPKWLKVLKDSELVLTDSFHCVCFSIMFRKQFVCFGNKTRGLARLNSLLKLVNLEDRLFMSFTEFVNSNVLSKSIEYNLIESRIVAHREFSLDFLKKALAD